MYDLEDNPGLADLSASVDEALTYGREAYEHFGLTYAKGGEFDKPVLFLVWPGDDTLSRLVTHLIGAPVEEGQGDEMASWFHDANWSAGTLTADPATRELGATLWTATRGYDPRRSLAVVAVKNGFFAVFFLPLP
jgi:hypothetical protein